MPTFERSGVRFDYPGNWKVEDEETGDGWTVTLQSPDTAFALVSLRPDVDSPALLAEEALDALRAEYPQLEIEAVIAALAGQPAVGHDIDFLTLDIPIQCWTRCIDTPGGSLLVMCQTSEFDEATNGPRLRALGDSLQVDD